MECRRYPIFSPSERHYLLGGASRRLGASLDHLPDWQTGEHGPGPGGPRVVRFIAMFWAILVLIPIGTGYPYTRIQVRTRELTLESGIMDPCLNRLRRVQCVSSRELHGARRADSNRLARLMLMRTDF